MPLTRRQFGWLTAGGALEILRTTALRAQAGVTLSPSPVDLQPLAEQARRVSLALQALGTPFSAADLSTLEHAANMAGGADSIQAVLDRRALMVVTINPESRLSAARGPAPAELTQSGWTTFLVKIVNQADVTSPFLVRSPQGGKMGRTSSLAVEGVHDFTNGAVDSVEARRRWIALSMYDLPPMAPRLSGLAVEYRILQIYSRDAGQREASLIADCGFGEQDLGFRSTLPVLFNCRPAYAVKLNIHNEHGTPCVASVLVHDALGRVYPAQGKRDLPDLYFQPQVYRADGETLLLGAGAYDLVFTRGPEYLPVRKSLHVAGATTQNVQLNRWVEPSRFGYFSGDTHIHAAGCSHYESPAEGVTPEVMERQVLGEALDLGSVLNWGPGFAYQKQFFSGSARPEIVGGHGTPHTILRYDVEVSGFPSSHCGHLVLLRLKQDDFPGAQNISDWPSWNLPILKWAKSQGAITGYAHSGHGLVTENTALPNFAIPPFDSSGANEFLVDVTHPGMVDFISGCDLWPWAELNLWYHTLNCGYRTAFAGETDFPCITDECVGGGRTYAKLDRLPPGEEGYSAWLKAFTTGSSYAGDGRSHIFNLRVESDGKTSDQHVDSPRVVKIVADIIAHLTPEPDAALQQIATSSPFVKPYWHIERARRGKSREVSVELIVNGRSMAELPTLADGSIHTVVFEHKLDHSSWYALRIYPSSHTQPLFVQVGGKPVRASRESALWCRRAVDALWEQKRLRIRQAELADATDAYNHARQKYDQIAAEAFAD